MESSSRDTEVAYGTLVLYAKRALGGFFKIKGKWTYMEEAVILTYDSSTDHAARVYARWGDTEGLHKNISLAFDLGGKNEFHCFGYVWKEGPATAKTGLINFERTDVHRVPYRIYNNGVVIVDEKELYYQILTCYRAILEVNKKEIEGRLKDKFSVDPFA